jgi:hypothetical protein
MGLEQCSKRFLEERSFKLNHDDNSDNSSLIECVGKLVERFEQATMKKESVELASSLLSKPFCRQLDPELQVLVEAKDNELNDTYELIDSCSPIHLRFASTRIHGLAIPTVYIAYPKDFIRDRDSEEMKKLRLIRRAIRWLHANLEILTHILQESVRQTVEPSAIEEYVQTLAEGLWQAPQQAKPQPRIVELLMNTLDSYHENSISRLVDCLPQSSLSVEAQKRIAHSLTKPLQQSE